MQPVGRLLRCSPFNPNTHVSVKMVSSRTENVSILFRDAPMPTVCQKKFSQRAVTCVPNHASQDDHSAANGQCPAKTWRRLKGENQLPKVVQGVKFQNGIEVIKMPAHHAA